MRSTPSSFVILWELRNFSPEFPFQTHRDQIPILPGEAMVLYNIGSNALTYNLYGGYYPQFHSIPGPDGLQLPGIS
jgi:hypothetical protein